MKTLQRIKVVLGSVVTWAAVVASLATLVVSNPELFPDGAIQIAGVVAAAAGGILSVIGAISRVTPVDASERGILPKG